MSNNEINFQNSVTTNCSFSDGSHAEDYQASVAYSPPLTSQCNGIDLWFLKSGDVNNDQKISAADRSEVNNNDGTTGYSLWDCFIDDQVNDLDLDETIKNSNAFGNVPQ